MVGRKKEIQELNDLYESGMAEFVAIYGRRRVGKTYLVDQTFEGRITFRHTGLSPIENKKADEGLLKAQLRSFQESMLRQGMEADHCPKDWMDAFFMLLYFWMNCHGWILLAPFLLQRLRGSGMAGAAIDLTSC